jgi:CopG family transcriptional regulator/antitoxin EndoAI
MRTTKVLSITLPAPMLEQAQAIARQENRTMSELVREALRQYQQQRRWERIAEIGQAAARRAGVRTEEDVVQLIHDWRKEKKRADKKARKSA